MSSFVDWFSVVIGWIGLPCLAMLSILFYKKQKFQGSLILAVGIITMTLGQLIKLLTPFGEMPLDEAGNILSSSGSPFNWYTGIFIFSLGLLTAVIGFALITFKNEKT
jgi:hypothetical protein